MGTYFSTYNKYILGFPGGSAVKNLPAMQETQETQVLSQGQKDPLEEGMATRFSILAWRIPRTEEPGGLHSPWGRKQSDMTGVTEHTHTHTHTYTHGFPYIHTHNNFK